MKVNSGENIYIGLVGMPKHQNEKNSSRESQVCHLTQAGQTAWFWQLGRPVLGGNFWFPRWFFSFWCFCIPTRPMIMISPEFPFKLFFTLCILQTYSVLWYCAERAYEITFQRVCAPRNHSIRLLKFSLKGYTIF